MCEHLTDGLFTAIRTSHMLDAGLVGGLAASRELNAFVVEGSFPVLLGLPKGWVMVTGALGASGSGFCWKPKSGGWASRLPKYDIALCKGAEVMGAWLIDYGGFFGRDVRVVDSIHVKHRQVLL